MASSNCRCLSEKALCWCSDKHKARAALAMTGSLLVVKLDCMA